MRLKNLAAISVSNVDKKSAEGQDPIRLCNYTDVYYGDDLSAAEGQYMRATASGTQVAAFRLETGDTVLTKDSETPADIGVSAYISESAPDFVCGYHLAILRPQRDLIDPRYLFWVTRGTAMRDQLRVAATGVTRYGLRSEVLANVDVHVPSLEDQRQTAKFLDVQVALLDQAIALRKRQATLLLERHDVEVDRRLRPEPSASRDIPARYLVQRIGVGIVIQPAALYSEDDDAIPAVRGKDISPGRIARVDALVRISKAGHQANPRSALHAGDILVVRSGKAGAAAQVPAELVGGNCIDVVMVRPGPEMNPRYLEHSINCLRAQESIVEHAAGAIQKHFGVEDMRALPIVPRSLQQQVAVGRALDDMVESTRRAADLLSRSVSLLNERKQSLITAAVTGQLDVTTARKAMADV